MKLKEKLLLLVVRNVTLHKWHNQCLHKSMIKMTMIITTTIYFHKICMQMALKMFPIAMIFILA